METTHILTTTTNTAVWTAYNDAIINPLMVPVTMTVIPPVYGVLLSADMSASGDVGTPVTYTIQITNTGNVSDTFDLAVAGESWTTTPGSSVMLAAGASATVTVQVLIPASAADGDSDGATITAVSQADPGASDSVTLTTTAVVLTYYIYIPLILKP